MSQSSTSTPAGLDSHLSSKDLWTVVGDDAVGGLLTALTDAYCRRILDATSERALSAKEVSEACEIPLSTTYRKLDQLTDAGLLDERTRIRRTGKHTSEYCRVVEDVVISLAPRGAVELRVAACPDADPFPGSLDRDG
jgi:DNA-binding transcriptional ArsR family regulator